MTSCSACGSRTARTNSGGKSGGHKEKLAYTILAAALAFQFGLASGKSADRNAGSARSFRFVVIDEAFDRGSANTNGDDSQLRNMTIQEYRDERDRRA
jgi:uncharacterized protein YPO0396